LSSSEPGDHILGAAEDEQAAEGDEFIIEPVLDGGDEGRGQGQPANGATRDAQRQMAAAYGQARGGGEAAIGQQRQRRLR
jgi:hypothetical protein